MIICSRRRFLESIGGAAAAVIQPAGPGAPKPPFEGRAPGERRELGGVSVAWCPPGRFLMGSPPSEPDRRVDEAQVAVALTRGFWMGRYEVTQGQWVRVMGQPPGRPLTAEFGLGDDVPKYWVSFIDAEAFCAALTRRAREDESLPAACEFRVPTEAQWEYAARAGTTTATAFGDSLSRSQANFSGQPLNGGVEGPAPCRAVPVGSYTANRWGIHDMHGNVFEWCRDYYHSRLPGGADPDLREVRGTPNRDGTFSRVRRGGAWNDDGRFLRSACRLRYEPERSSDHIGFRVALVKG